MYFKIERIKRITTELESYIHVEKESIDEYKVKECSYGDLSLLEEDAQNWDIFKGKERWGGLDKHFWFKTLVEIPKAYQDKSVIYEITTGREGQWDAINPQF